MILLLVAVVNAAFSQVASDSLSALRKDSLLQSGVRMYSESNYERTIGIFASIPPDSLSAPALFYTGLSYGALNDLQKARQFLFRAVAKDSLNLSYRYNYGLLLARLGDIGGAIEEYKTIGARDSLFFPALEQLGQLCELWQKESVAFRDSVWARVLGLRPNDYVALYYCGLAMFRRGMQDSGFVCLERAVHEDSMFFAAVYELALRNLARKNIQQTFDWYERAVQLRPTNAKVLAELGTLFQKTGKHRPAIPYFVRAMQYDTANASYVEQTGLLYYSLGSFDTASVYLRRAVTLEKDNWSYFLNLALAYNQMDSTRLAVRALKDAISAFHLDDGSNLYLRLANILSNRTEYGEAKRMYERALEVDPANPEPRFRLALMYVQMENRESARKEFQKYLQALPADTTTTAKREMVQNWLRYLSRPKSQ